jgi:hypothetical protein
MVAEILLKKINYTPYHIIFYFCIFVFQDGLVKNNMDKLTYYAMSNSEKLDRIGSYLEQKLSRDLQRRRIG